MLVVVEDGGVVALADARGDVVHLLAGRRVEREMVQPGACRSNAGSVLSASTSTTYVGPFTHDRPPSHFAFGS
jgi:hypothetical protein